jgi:hypothetical protein
MRVLLEHHEFAGLSTKPVVGMELPQLKGDERGGTW